MQPAFSTEISKVFNFFPETGFRQAEETCSAKPA